MKIIILWLKAESLVKRKKLVLLSIKKLSKIFSTDMSTLYTSNT